MIWNFGGPNFDSIKNLVSAKGTTLEAVLCDSALTQSLRFETEEVISFFSNEQNIKGLLKWSLGLDEALKSDPNFFRFSRLATNVLSASCVDLQNALIDSNLLIPTFTNFFGTLPSPDGINGGHISTTSASTTITCGNYQRIVEHFIRVTHGEVLDKIPKLPESLVGNLHILSFKLLLYDLIVDLREYLTDTKPVMDKLAEVIGNGGPTAFNCVGLLKELLKCERNPLNNEQMEKIVFSLFEFAILEKSTPLYKTEAYGVIELIYSKFKNQNFADIIKQYEDKVNFESTGIDGIAVFRLYPNHLSQAFKKFFSDITNSFIGQICLSSIRTQNDVIEFVKANDILANIIERFTDEKCSGHLTQIALFLSELDFSDNTEWQNFISNQLAEKKKLLEESRNYGGDRPSMIRQDTSIAKSANYDIQPISNGKTKISNDSAFNFNSDSDEEESSNEDDNEGKGGSNKYSNNQTATNQTTTHRIGIQKDPVQNLQLSTSSDEEHQKANEEEEEEEEGDEEGKEPSQSQQFNDLMKQIWGFMPAEPEKKEENGEEEDGDEEDSYSSYEPDDDE